MAWLALFHGALFVCVPSAPLIAIGVWWNSNTVSHNFIHRPFFRGRRLNAIFAAYLSLLLGIPQAWWRKRHLAHHGIAARPAVAARPLEPLRRASEHDRAEAALQIALVIGLWIGLLVYAPEFFVGTYVPGYVAGLGLCALHGHYEHARGTTSHYGRLYNLLCFNDGYHVEHHRHPGVHWAALPGYRTGLAPASAWPAPLRWLDIFSLTGLERVALRSPALQRFMIRTHACALRALTGALRPQDRIAIVGGGLFPRTALVLQGIVPDARITIVDSDRGHLERAQQWLDDSRTTFVHARYEGGPIKGVGAPDVVIIPLAFDGDRAALYQRPPAATLIVHDWIWRKRGRSRVVSLLLLKRINVIDR